MRLQLFFVLLSNSLVHGSEQVNAGDANVWGESRKLAASNDETKVFKAKSTSDGVVLKGPNLEFAVSTWNSIEICPLMEIISSNAKLKEVVKEKQYLISNFAISTEENLVFFGKDTLFGDRIE